MQVVIEISKKDYRCIKEIPLSSMFAFDNWKLIAQAIANGTPLDDVKAEIREHCERYMDGDIIADEVIQAVENICKTESEET